MEMVGLALPIAVLCFCWGSMYILTPKHSDLLSAIAWSVMGIGFLLPFLSEVKQARSIHASLWTGWYLSVFSGVLIFGRFYIFFSKMTELHLTSEVPSSWSQKVAGLPSWFSSVITIAAIMCALISVFLK